MSTFKAVIPQEKIDLAHRLVQASTFSSIED